jgi:hypothetical protein
MSVYTMVVLIVLIVTAGRIYAARQKAGLRQPLSGQDSVDKRRLEAEVTRLNERIAVLERLATDPSKRLADEIDSLKSLPFRSTGPKAPTEETDNAQR